MDAVAGFSCATSVRLRLISCYQPQLLSPVLLPAPAVPIAPRADTLANVSLRCYAHAADAFKQNWIAFYVRVRPARNIDITVAGELNRFRWDQAKQTRRRGRVLGSYVGWRWLDGTYAAAQSGNPHSFELRVRRAYNSQKCCNQIGQIGIEDSAMWSGPAQQYWIALTVIRTTSIFATDVLLATQRRIWTLREGTKKRLSRGWQLCSRRTDNL